MRIFGLLIAIAAASLFLQGLFLSITGPRPDPPLILQPATWAIVAFLLAGLRLAQVVIGRDRRT